MLERSGSLKHRESGALALSSEILESYIRSYWTVEEMIESLRSKTDRRVKEHQNLYTSIKELTMGDKYTAGQVGAQGPEAHASHMEFHQMWNNAQHTIALDQLTTELAVLRAHLRSEQNTPEQDAQLGVIAQAELAAKDGKGAEVLEWLSKTGKWVFDNATKIGVGVATAALKFASGL